MKKFTVGIFEAREDAEKAVSHVHTDLHVPSDAISFVYRNSDGQVREVAADNIAARTPSEAAGDGAVAGALVGAVLGIIVAIGVVPGITSLFAIGSLATTLGLAGAVLTTLVVGVIGAALGSILSGVFQLFRTEEHSQRYADRVHAGDIVVAAYADETTDVRTLFEELGALKTTTYALRM